MLIIRIQLDYFYINIAYSVPKDSHLKWMQGWTDRK
jgi:hypothetical protein